MNTKTILAMPEGKPKEPFSLMITNIQPRIILSGDIDKIFDEMAQPKVTYDFTVSLSFGQINNLMKWMIDADLIPLAGAAIEKGENTAPAQLLVEFKNAVERILAQK